MSDIKILGIDQSISSTGFTLLEVDENFNIKDWKFLGFSSTKKRLISTNHYMTIKKPDNYENHPYFYKGPMIFEYIYKEYSDYINFVSGVDYFSVEDYAYGAEGNIFDIAEFCGGLENSFYVCGKSFKRYPPRSIKLFATGNGDADKFSMGVQFMKTDIYKETKEGFGDCFESGFTHPYEDIIGSFWMANCFRCELAYRTNKKFPDQMYTSIENAEISILKSKNNKSLSTINHSINEFEKYKKPNKKDKYVE